MPQRWRKIMTKEWEMFNNKTNKSEFEEEFNKLLQDIMSEGLAKIESLTDEELDKLEIE
jgi:hypothetical protein